MPNITSTGTYTKNSAGLSTLSSSGSKKTLLFAPHGTPSLGGSCLIQYEDDQGVKQTFENGVVDTLPTSRVIEANIDIEINVSGGSPSFNLTVLPE